MTRYIRPIPLPGYEPAPGALPLAGGPMRFVQAEVLTRGGPSDFVAAGELAMDERERICAPRAPLAGLSLDRARLMGILNVTPDSFSDGGRFEGPGAAMAQSRAMIGAGADILDIGGESTRPGAAEVPVDEEIARVLPVIAAVSDLRPISIDTRKASVAAAALEAGARMVNDVSALTFDAAMAGVVADHGAPLVLMHAQGDPATMQDAPRYDDVLLDVFDHLATRVAAAEAAGIDRTRIVIDPGIGFGKTLDHNLTLLRGLSLFHALGCAILVGASRKRFIGTLSGVTEPDRRMAGSVAVALLAARQGVQILRVHDIAETRQALDLQEALDGQGRAE